ncbi:Sensor kinase CusS [compost metagenome]
MTALVDEYLTSDRMEAGQTPFQPRPCERDELMELFEDLVADWPDGRVVWHDGQLPPQLVCDPGLLRVALRNLLANADRHTPAGRAIVLDVVPAGPDGEGGLNIRVSNPGDAIPHDEVPRLFEKYFRGRQAARSPGAGLGLYLVHQIAELHRGHARLDSAGQDGHVRFSLALP